jgi:hypothetical protein
MIQPSTSKKCLMRKISVQTNDMMQRRFIRRLSILACMLVGGAGLPAQSGGAKVEWEEFKAFDGRFRVLAPGPMQERTDSIETPVGKLAYHVFFHQPADKDVDNLVYMVSYCDYPEHTIHSDSTMLVEEFFAATIDQAAKSVRGELLYSDAHWMRRYPGRIWRIHYLNGKAVIKTKAYLVDRRFYTVQAIMFREKSLNPASEKFLDSFRLLN